MASNVADTWLFFPAQTTATTIIPIDFTVAAIKQCYPIPSRCQVKEFGVIITTTFSANATDPIVKLQRITPIGGTTSDLFAVTLGSSNTTLRKYTVNPDAVAAGGPGTVLAGPSIGGHTTALTADTGLIAGVVVLADGTGSPTTMLQPGDVLQVNVTTAATTGGGGICFVRLEIAGEQYTTAYVNYTATP